MLKKKSNEVSYLLKHIRKLRKELRYKNRIIKKAYDNLIDKNWDSPIKVIYTANILAIEIKRQNEIDKKILKRLNLLFSDAEIELKSQAE